MTRTGLRKKSARRTWSKSGFALMPVVLAEAGSSTGVGSNVSKGLLSLICVSTGTIRAEESTPKSGFLTSPNYPELYPNSHDSTQTIQVTEGKIIKITFTDFNTQHGRDTVEFVDGDGISLSLCQPKLSGMSGIGHCESSTFTSNSNIVHVKFHTGQGERLETHGLQHGIR